jgi:hypothetical protein
MDVPLDAKNEQRSSDNVEEAAGIRIQPPSLLPVGVFSSNVVPISVSAAEAAGSSIPLYAPEFHEKFE